MAKEAEAGWACRQGMSRTCSQPDPDEPSHLLQFPFTDLVPATDPALEETSGYPTTDCSLDHWLQLQHRQSHYPHPAMHLQLVQQQHTVSLTALSHHNTGPHCSPHILCTTGQAQTSAVQWKEEGDDVSTLRSQFLPRVLRQQRSPRPRTRRAVLEKKLN